MVSNYAFRLDGANTFLMLISLMGLHKLLLAKLLDLADDLWRRLVLQVRAQPGQLRHRFPFEHARVREVHVNGSVVQTAATMLEQARHGTVLGWHHHHFVAALGEGIAEGGLRHLRARLAVRSVVVGPVPVGEHWHVALGQPRREDVRRVVVLRIVLVRVQRRQI